jgi:nucleoside-diphosphate-sugar epimerase
MKFLVTGATGFIGLHLAERLAEGGADVVGLVRETSSKEKIAGLEKLGVEVVRGDLRRKESLAGLPGDVDGVFHLAALIDHSIQDYSPFHETNVVGTRNLAEHYIGRGIKNFVFMSSIAAIGLPKTETGVVDERVTCNPRTVYGKSKHECEKMLLDHFKESGFPVTILRPPTVYGPGGGGGILETVRFVKQKIRTGRPVVHICRGETMVAFCYVDNLVDALVLAMDVKQKGEVFHVDDGRPYTNKEVLDTISGVFGKPLVNLYIPKILLYLAACTNELAGKVGLKVVDLSRQKLEELSTGLAFDTTKARKILSYNPGGDFRSFVKKTVTWYRENGLL